MSICSSGDNMVILAEIIIGIIGFLVGLFVVLDAYKDYHNKENIFYVGDFLVFVEYLLGFSLITMCFIVSILGAERFYNIIYHILSMEVF